ncbi:hypothetical protein VW29_01545 [Devosia limi DSM 17137]|uniref:Very-short-patch-repair endonuclease n=1 Tax=Devosia limi DSM 17137 TaxID=1121477 RepID=A0A0F5LYA4_9HYPH|nr:hypothetical protein VW29_01545 [Devosia limi DSM 17137]SHF66315.1 Very-short-patch-repair endonuclease [Devosia limi DSM 17137]
MNRQISLARKLRREQTPAERRFWVVLQPWRETGWHFRRQAPIGPFVVDFVCKREKLVFEIDGDSHYSAAGVARDAQRTGFLAGQGYRVVRFSNADVLGNPEGVFAVVVGILGEPGRAGRAVEAPT